MNKGARGLWKFFQEIPKWNIWRLLPQQLGQDTFHLGLPGWGAQPGLPAPPLVTAWNQGRNKGYMPVGTNLWEALASRSGVDVSAPAGTGSQGRAWPAPAPWHEKICGKDRTVETVLLLGGDWPWRTTVWLSYCACEVLYFSCLLSQIRGCPLLILLFQHSGLDPSHLLQRWNQMDR